MMVSWPWAFFMWSNLYCALNTWISQYWISLWIDLYSLLFQKYPFHPWEITGGCCAKKAHLVWTSLILRQCGICLAQFGTVKEGNKILSSEAVNTWCSLQVAIESTAHLSSTVTDKVSYKSSWLSSGNKKKIFFDLLADLSSLVLSLFCMEPKSALSLMKALPRLKITCPMKWAANIEDRAMLWQSGSSVLVQSLELGRLICLVFHCASSRTGAHNANNATYNSQNTARLV